MTFQNVPFFLPEGEEASDAAATEQTQSQDALGLLGAVQAFAGGTLQGDWNLAPWVQQAVAQAQAESILVDGVPGEEGTAAAQQALTDTDATDQSNQEQEDADAEYGRDLSTDLDDYNQTVGDAQVAHDAQYAVAASDTALVRAGAFPASLPGSSTAPDDGTPLTASANYGLTETIGGYLIGPATGDYAGLVNGMFSLGPSDGPAYTGWNGWSGWDNAWAPTPAASGSGSSGGDSGGTDSSESAGGVWSADGATPPPQAPQTLAFADAAPGGGANPQGENGSGQPDNGGATASGGTATPNPYNLSGGIPQPPRPTILGVEEYTKLAEDAKAAGNDYDRFTYLQAIARLKGQPPWMAEFVVGREKEERFFAFTNQAIKSGAGAAALVGGAMAVPLVGIPAGVILLIYGTYSSADKRIGDGQTAGQVAVGTLSDLSGVTGTHVYFTNEDPITGKFLGLNDAQRGAMGGAGFVNIVMLTTGLVTAGGKSLLAADTALAGRAPAPRTLGEPLVSPSFKMLNDAGIDLSVAPELARNEWVSVFRTQGGSGTKSSHELIIIGRDGNAAIQPKTVNISVGNAGHAEYFAGLRPGRSEIVTFEIPTWLADFIEAESVFERNYRTNPQNQGGLAPKFVDRSITDLMDGVTAYQLPKVWSAWLQEYARPGSGDFIVIELDTVGGP